MFICGKDETLSQVHQRFNCLLIDLKTVDKEYPNSEVLTKVLEWVLGDIFNVPKVVKES